MPDIQGLPRQNASRGTAVINHSEVEMALLDSGMYQQLTEDIQAPNAREQTALEELTNGLNAQHAMLQQPDAGQKLNALLDAKGGLTKRPKAGASY